MNKNKYYTPEIEEFHVGFECQYKDNPQKDKWEDVKTDSEFIGIVQNGYENEYDEYIYNKRFRVKYLDEEDILELGWNKKSSQYRFNEFELEIKENRVLTMTTYFSYPNAFAILYYGPCKNKSELKRIMKQLNITS